MCSLVKWMAELKVKKRLQSKLKSEKKKTEVLKKKAEAKKKEKEVKFEQEANKVDNFVDEAFHEVCCTSSAGSDAMSLPSVGNRLKCSCRGVRSDVGQPPTDIQRG